MKTKKRTIEQELSGSFYSMCVKIFGVVYEYDWWAIKKPISITSQDPNSANSITIRFKAKYSSDNYEIYREEDLTYLTNGDYYIGSHSKLYQDL